MTIIDHIRELTGCEAVGIRLHKEGDYPYYVYGGFPESFILKESSLCSKDEHGERIPSPDGSGWLLDCMCGNILQARFDPGLPFFTEKGSFWSNNTTALLASTTEKERQARTRNYCNSCGYESVALVPIKSRDNRIGLVQLNDHRIGMFDRSLIEFMEMLGEHIGLAIENSQIHTDLKKTADALSESNESLAREVEVRRSVEESLREAMQELERSNRELEQFAYVASHDLQEPLRIVSSFASLLANRCKGRLDRDADEFIAFITDGAARMQRLINDLLSYSRVGRGKKPFTRVDCRSVVEQALANLSLAVEESKAEIKCDELPVAKADEMLLVQLFQNLIGNGIKFRRDAPPEIHISAEPLDGERVFRVSDNGIGIEARHMERIFLIFQRLHGAGKYPGTGIGLAICKKILEYHRGRIWVESTPGEGSTFCFTLPREGSE
jgi:signal transduction histidine kinase